MRPFSLCFAITCLISNAIHSQDLPTLRGLVVSETKTPLPFATIQLMSSLDSSMAKGAITDREGRYLIENVPKGNYWIRASMVGYETFETEGFSVRSGISVELPVITLSEGITLDEVAITASKLLYELKPDRIVMNIDALPTASGNDGLELLQKVPGLIVDKQNNRMAMNAKGEVLVMIDEKVQRVPGDVLMARLRSIRAENIERIEIIQQPPAKYDASGAAGILNIVLKKNNKAGTNGSLTAAGGYGQREKAGMSLSVNSRKKNMNWFGDYNFNWGRANAYQLNHYREYEFEGDRYFNKNTAIDRNYRTHQHSANLGLDVDINGNTVIGLLMGGVKSDLVWGSQADSRSFGYVNDALISQDEYLFSTKTKMSSFAANANVFQKIGSGSQLTANIDYTKLHYENSGDLRDRHDPHYAVRYERSTPMEIWIAGVDMTNQLGASWQMEFGLKGTLNTMKSGTHNDGAGDIFWQESELLTRDDKLLERIVASYLSFAGDISKAADLELGLRYEHYTYQLDADENGDIFNVINKPFPVARLNFEVDSAKTLQVGFNRSITRPSFFHLTNFLVLFDPSLIIYANPRLLPTFANTVRLSYQHHQVLISLSYIERKNQIYFYNTVDKEEHLQTSSPANLDMEKLLEVSLSLPVSPARWWEMTWNISAHHHLVKDASNRPLPFIQDMFTFNVQAFCTFLLGNDWSIAFDGMYRSPFLLGDQRQYTSPYLNLGVRKALKSGGTLSIALQDAFNSSGILEWEYFQPELDVKTFGYNDFSERQLRITYTQPFGNSQVKEKRKRKTGAEEIKDRM